MPKPSKGTGRKGVRVTKESSTGRNTHFTDGNKNMTRAEFVKEINKGNYPGYDVKNIHNKPTPVSKPDKSSGNNLG